jgi:TetR/AcrR family transcriptional regulator, cholesterol catabolism regulator
MDTLNKILNASAELFRQFGFKTVTMDDIARRAGVSKKTLYQYFPNKNEVVNQSVTWYKAKITELIESAMDQAENAIQGMVRIMGMFDQINKQINPRAMLELERYYPEGFSRFKSSLIEKDVVAIQKNIIRGIEEGFYREGINAGLMAHFRMELSLIIFHPRLIVQESYDWPELAQEIGEHFLYGIMTPKGEKLYKKYKEAYLKQVTRI